jgi:hypothetical protein
MWSKRSVAIFSAILFPFSVDAWPVFKALPIHAEPCPHSWTLYANGQIIDGTRRDNIEPTHDLILMYNICLCNYISALFPVGMDMKSERELITWASALVRNIRNASFD